MADIKILVVEDEVIVAEDIASSLKNVGYVVQGITHSGEEAIEIAREAQPDLVLMDIILSGKTDGVTAAEQIYTQLNIPVVYLTSHSDSHTLHRAKKTQPFGYILKPFREKDLYANIEMALYKDKAAKISSNTMKLNAKKIYLVDDHPVMRRGLKQLINHEADLSVCGEAEDTNDALEAIAALQPELVIVDSFLKKMSSHELIKQIKRYHANLPILVLSMHDESLYAERALQAGANGYIMKHEKGEKIIAAIRQIIAGDIYVSDKIGAKIMKKFFGGHVAQPGSGDLEKLSDRELEVFQLIGTGQKTSQIAKKLHLSIKTIDTYRANIKKKFDLKDANEVLQRAIKWNQMQNIC